MIFNIGWMCQECGPVAESKKRAIAKVQYDCCKVCGGIVQKWTRPLNERAGRCKNCAGASFTMALVKHQLLRCCKQCGEVVNTDQDCKVVRKGEGKRECKG